MRDVPVTQPGVRCAAAPSAQVGPPKPSACWVPAVRGAYMVLERQRAQDLGYPSPIHDTVADTHANYNE